MGGMPRPWEWDECGKLYVVETIGRVATCQYRRYHSSFGACHIRSIKEYNVLDLCIFCRWLLYWFYYTRLAFWSCLGYLWQVLVFGLQPSSGRRSPWMAHAPCPPLRWVFLLCSLWAASMRPSGNWFLLYTLFYCMVSVRGWSVSVSLLRRR